MMVQGIQETGILFSHVIANESEKSKTLPKYNRPYQNTIGLTKNII